MDGQEMLKPRMTEYMTNKHVSDASSGDSNMTENLSAPNLWKREYRKSGIPSSFREEPSGSVVDFIRYLKDIEITTGRALDIGCGRGRNSLYMSKAGFNVFSVDFVPEIIEDLKFRIEDECASNKIHPYCGNVVDAWPFDNSFIDIAVDAFCYKHQLSMESRLAYRKELSRCLKIGSYYMLTLAGKDDGYYGPLLEQSPSPQNDLIIDPVNNIGSILYNIEDIEREFCSDFVLAEHQHKKKMGMMHGSEYMRSTHVLFFRRK